MQDVPWWGLASSALAPVVLIGGFTAAASLQPRFDPVAETVSALAAPGATDRWLMSLTFVLVGVCYIVTGLALRPARTPGRVIMIGAALVGMLVVAFPLNAEDAAPLPHIIAGAIGFAGLATWPAGACRPGPAVPWTLRPAAAAAAVAVLLALVAWFTIEVILFAGQVGLSERALGSAQALWPLVVVWSLRFTGSSPGHAGNTVTSS